MKTQQEIQKNFVINKSAEELQNALEQHQIAFKSLESEFKFYEFLLDSSKFKSPVMNLFEKLTQFKIEISTLNKNRALLLNKTKLLINKIASAPFKKYDIIIHDLKEIETEINDFNTNVTLLKSSMFEYLQGVIIR